MMLYNLAAMKIFVIYQRQCELPLSNNENIIPYRNPIYREMIFEWLVKYFVELIKKENSSFLVRVSCCHCICLSYPIGLEKLVPQPYRLPIGIIE